MLEQIVREIFNFTYEVTTEEVAFLPEIIIPKIVEVTKIDTIKVIDTIKKMRLNPDSIKLESINSKINNDTIEFDTIYRDSIVKSIEFKYFPEDITLRMFIEEANNQFVAEKKREEKGKLEISFSLPTDSSFLLEAIDLENSKNWQILEKIDDKTYTIWISDSTIYNKEELLFLAHYQTLDSLKNTIIESDTLSFKYFEEKKEQAKEELTININATKKIVELFEPLQVTFSVPLASFIADSLKLYELQDTLEIPIKFKATKDSILQRQYNLYFERKAETDYKILLDSAALYDIFGNTNNVFESKFQIQDSSFYSDIILKVSNIDTFSIVQLLNKDKELLKEHYVQKDSATINFKFLSASEYFLKIITDPNNNKKWDY